MAQTFGIGRSAATLRTFFQTSFVRKVVGLCVLTSAVALLLALFATQWQAWRLQERDLISDHSELAEYMLPLFGEPTAENLALVESLIVSSHHTNSVAYYPADGAPYVVVSPVRPRQPPPPRGLARPDVVDQPHGAILYVPHVVEGRRVGELVMLADDWEVHAALQQNILTALIVMLFTLLVVGLIAGALAYRTLRPLHVLNGAIERVRETRNFGSKVTVSCEDEIGRLTENFNALLGDLDVYSKSLEIAASESIAARDAAQDANVQKSLFLANMSHEIRTPLNGVLGMAQVMSRNPLNAKQRERLDVIRASGTTLLTVLNDILDFSKIEAGKLDIEWEPFDLDDLAGGACAGFASMAESKGLSFVLGFADNAKGWWRGDSVRLRQVIYNLVSNAIKFTDEGEVRLSIDVSATEAGESLHLSIIDTGIGISPEQLARLFDKFSQADNSTTRRFGGTGLGLAICKQIVELMGGRIETQSELGRGATFEVWLPLERHVLDNATAQDAAPDVVDLSSLRVLAAEDNQTNQLVLSAIFQALGVSPVIVADGAAAVEAWRTQAFDLILMDINMPVMDGITATARIRALEQERKAAPIRIVALSANAMRHQVSEYIAAGMDGHLAKPIVIEALYEVLVDADTHALARCAA